MFWVLYGCVVSVWFIGFVSLDVVCDELNECVLNLGLYQFSECYSDCLLRGIIWLNPFATMLFYVCIAVTV